MESFLPDLQSQVVLDLANGEVGFVQAGEPGTFPLCCLYTSFFAHHLTRRMYSSQLDTIGGRSLYAAEVDILYFGSPQVRHRFLVAASSLEEAEDLACPLVDLYAAHIPVPNRAGMELLSCARELAEPELRFIRDNEVKHEHPSPF